MAVSISMSRFQPFTYLRFLAGFIDRYFFFHLRATTVSETVVGMLSNAKEVDFCWIIHFLVYGTLPKTPPILFGSADTLGGNSYATHILLRVSVDVFFVFQFRIGVVVFLVCSKIHVAVSIVDTGKRL